MKRIILILLTVVIVFSFGRCTASDIDTAITQECCTENTEAAEPPAEADTTIIYEAQTEKSSDTITEAFIRNETESKEQTTKATENNTAQPSPVFTETTVKTQEDIQSATTKASEEASSFPVNDNEHNSTSSSQNEEKTTLQQDITASETLTQQSEIFSTQNEAVTQNICTVTIRCDTVLNNISSVHPGKSEFIPTDGIILKDKAVSFNENDSVFDVLKKACKENTCNASCKYCKAGGIQFEYTYTPVFNNYYIEGIHHLYEKDCGSLSGWMYSVNGVYPNTGISSYTVQNGDRIIIAYTCNMGEDIGNSF